MNVARYKNCTINFKYEKEEELVYFNIEDKNQICYIDSILVNKSYQNQGFGTAALLEFLNNQKKLGIRRFYLFAVYHEEDYNDPIEDKSLAIEKLLNYYENIGFEVVSEKRNIDPVDMRLQIKED